MDGEHNYYDQVLEFYDDGYWNMKWKIIGQMSVARKAHAVSIVTYESVCPGDMPGR